MTRSSSFLSALLATRRRDRRRPAPRVGRLAVERLEDRIALSTFNVNTTTDTLDALPGDGLARDASGNTSLRAAVMEANALLGADTINLPAGTYVLGRLGSEENANLTGDLDVFDHLTIVGAGAATTRLDNSNVNDRFFDVFRGGTPTAPRTVAFSIQGVTLLGGRVVQVNDNLGDRGGAIRTDFLTDVTASNCVFTNNSAPRAQPGLIFGLGGAITSSGRLTVTGCTFSGNFASNSGGAIYIGGSGAVTTIRNTTFTNNRSDGGGAIKNHAEMTIESSTFSGNGSGSTDRGNGGAIDNNGGGDLTMTNCTLSGNTADFGGAIYNADTILLTNCTLAGNSARWGGGLDTSFDGVDALRNTIIAGNTAVLEGPDVRGLVRSQGNNLVGDTTDSSGWSVSLSDLLNVDPRLGALASNGGPTQTRALLSGSPAINAANTTLAPATDQRGVSRPQGPAADIGAFEFQSTRPPVANNQTWNTYEDLPLTGTLSATDPDGNPLTYAVVSGPAHGTVQVTAATGAFVYTPAANYFGPDSFTYKANDGSLDSNVATVNISVNPLNDAPDLGDQRFTIDEDAVLDTRLTATDVDSTTLTYRRLTAPSNGLAAVQSNGRIVYVPNFNWYGTDSFTVEVSDGSLTDTATVTVVVNAVNDAPFVDSPTVTTPEDQTLNARIDYLEVEGDPVTFAVLSGPAHGAVTLGNDGTFTYTPAPDFNGTDSFTFRASDDKNATRDGTVTIQVTPVNDAPGASNDSYAVDEDQTLTLSVGALTGLAMVSEPGDWVGDGRTWNYAPPSATITARTYSTNGVQVNVDGSEFWILIFDAPTGAAPLSVGTYLDARRFPDATHPGLDVFGDGRGHNQLVGSFLVRDVAYNPDGSVQRFAATFVQQGLNFDGTVDPPMRGTVQFNTTLGARGGVLANDSDVDGDRLLSAALVSGPSHGTLALNRDGTFTYTPSANYHGTDSFTYRIGDGQAESNVATVTITVRPVNDAPVAANDTAATDEDTAVTVNVLANDTDIDGDTLTPSVVSGPSHGTLTLNADRTFTYTPAANYNGPDSFTYRVSDGAAGSNVATVSLTVRPVNDAPTAQGNAYTTAEDTALTIAAPGVLGNDGDIDGDALRAILVSGPSHATLTLNNDGSFSYTPAASYHGSDSFSYRAGDGAATSNVATVSLTVTPVNDAPTAGNDSYSTTAGVALSVAAPGLLGNDGDIDGDALAVQLVSGPANGTLTLNANGSFTYTPVAGFTGTDTFSYRASDGSATSAVVTVTLTVTPSNVPGVTFEADPCDPTGVVMVVRGTSGNDDIDVKRTGSSSRIDVTIRSAAFNFSGSYPLTFTRIFLYGFAGNDTIRVQDTVTLPAVLFGGDGDDRLQGGGGPTVLIGGDGGDQLNAGRGRSVLIAGRGEDQLKAQGDSLLLAGFTDQDANAAALCELLEAWSAPQSESARSAGMNSWLVGAGVHDDGDEDVLIGGSGRDWFFATLSGTGRRRDRVNGASSGETVTDTAGW